MKLTMLTLLAVILLALTGPCFAQTPDPAVDLPAGINPNLRVQLGTVTGIAALSLLLVQLVKWSLAKYDIGILSKLPTPVFVVTVGVALTVLANLVIKTLPGDLLDLVWQGIFASGMSSAVFSWLKNGWDAPADKSATTPMTGKASWLGVLMLPLVLAMTGCGQISPAQQYVIASQSYATTMNVLSDLRAAGMFTTADRKLITQLSDKADVLLDEMATDILDGKTINLPYMLAKVNAVLDDLLTIQLQAQADKKAAQPSGKLQPTTQQAQTAGKALSDGRSTGNHPGVESGDGSVDGPRQRPGGLAADGPAAAGGSGGLSDGDPQGGQGPMGRWRGPITNPIPLTALVEVEWD